MKKALITGISGQDGSYLAEFLLEKKYLVFGISNNLRSVHNSNVSHLQGKIELIMGDLNDPSFIFSTVASIQPNEIYNLASQSYPGNSWSLALETSKINGLGAHSLFDVVKQVNPQCKIYQASSSDMYGEIVETPQNEQTPFNPTNPYAAAKLYAHHIAKIYRKSYDMFISCGILFNHESPRRGMHFITQKVTYAAACLKLGIETSPQLNERGVPIVNNKKLLLGNLNATRDWGFAGDYVEAMWLMLQQPTPDDFVIGTGQPRTIKELCHTAFSYVGLDWEDYVEIDANLIRPLETGPTIANIKKAKKILRWQAKTSFQDLIQGMVDNHVHQILEKKHG